MYILAIANSEAYEIGYRIGTIFGVVFLICLFMIVPILFIIFLIQAIRKKTRGWITVAIITGIFSLIPVGLVTAGVIKGISEQQKYVSTKQDIPANREIISKDKICKLTIPEHWKILKGLNDGAVIQVGNTAREEYLMVLVDPKENVDESVTLKEYANGVTDKVVGALKNGYKKEPAELKINGLNAIWYKIYGTSGQIKLIYLHTTLEGEKTYYRVVGWTVPSKANEAMGVLRKAVSTFAEVKSDKSDSVSK